MRENLTDCLKLHEHSFVAYPHRPPFQVIPFAADIPAIGHAEFIPVNRTNHIAERIYITFCEKPAGMRTFMRECKCFIPENANTNGFAISVCFSNTIPEIQFSEAFSHFDPTLHYPEDLNEFSRIFVVE